VTRSTSPFGAGSGGAGGDVTTAETKLLARINAGNAYPWLYPTADFRSFDKFGAQALAAIGAETVIGDANLGHGNSMPWNVPKGYNGFIKAIAIEFVPNGSMNLWTPGVLPQQLSFIILVDGKPAYDYGNIAYSPGAINSPTPIAGVPIKENNVVQVAMLNKTITVDTQFVMARLQGYYYGKQFEPKGQAF
jgi:hypothetical protein